MKKNNILKCSDIKLNNVKYIFVIIAAVYMVLGIKSYATSASELPEMYASYLPPDSDQFLTGWLKIDNSYYYFLPDSGQMAVGWQIIDNESYFFLPDSGRMLTEWLKIGDDYYYFLPDSGQMATEWQIIDKKSYYFLPDSGQMAAGWQIINGKSYFFETDSGQMLTGHQIIDGKSYFFLPDSGQMATGCLEFEDNTYYFSLKTGEMLTGWQETEMGLRYFSKDTGKMLTGWQKIKNKKYYFSMDNGEPSTGLKKIDGEYYLFHYNGQLAESKKTSLVTDGKQIYCADKNGKAASGWQVVDQKLYFASKTGKVKKNTTFRGITFDSNGAAKNNVNTRLKIKAMKIFSSITKENMTKSQKLAECWSYMIGGSFRYSSKYPDLNADDWQRETAYDMLSSHTGNCYSFACAFAALAAEAGYHPFVVCGRVHGSRDRMADGYTRHAWVRINDRYYDPEAHYAGWRRGIYDSSTYPVSHTVQKIVAF